MKKLVVLLFGVFSITISAQENHRTSHFNLHPKPKRSNAQNMFSNRIPK